MNVDLIDFVRGGVLFCLVLFFVVWLCMMLRLRKEMNSLERRIAEKEEQK